VSTRTKATEAPATLSDVPALLLVWLSPAFPVGAFAYSHGLEKAVEKGLIKDRETLGAWLGDLIAIGSLHNDLIVLAAAWRAASRQHAAELAEVAELAAALQPSAERRLETVTQGGSFLSQIDAAWPCAAVGLLRAAHAGDIAYPVAVGVAAAGHALSLAPSLLGYGMAFVGNLLSASIRLSIIGQTDGQRLTAALLPPLQEAASRAADSTLDHIGSATFAADLASIQHETQYTRLFRS
jgi:urease accessory protein